MIFQVGFNKSGSTSLAKALDIFGFNVSHYHLKGSESVFLHNIVNKNMSMSRDVLFGIPKDMDAILDCNPIMTESSIYTKLYYEHPGSKFIFLDREFNAWYISMIKHALKNHYINEDYIYDRDWFFEQHVRVKTEILSFFANKTNFLHLNLCEEPTWDKLCGFVNEKIPSIPFPKLNSIPVDYDYLLLILKMKNYKYFDDVKSTIDKLLAKEKEDLVVLSKKQFDLN